MIERMSIWQRLTNKIIPVLIEMNAAKTDSTPSFPGFAPTGTTLCPQCDYDLQHLPAAHRCPECGLEYDEKSLVVEQTTEPAQKGVRELAGNVSVASVGCYLTVTSLPRPWNLLMIPLVLGLLITMWYGWHRLRTPPRQLIGICPGGVLIRDGHLGVRFWPYPQIKHVRRGNILGIDAFELMLDRDQTPKRVWGDHFVPAKDDQNNIKLDDLVQRARDYLEQHRLEHAPNQSSK